jgi:NADH:ubiquinone oxidoreductase subunit E
MKIKDLPKYELHPDEILKVDEIINRYKGKKGALIPILNEIQNEIGFLPIEIQEKVAKGLNIPEKEVYGVVTFYSFFSLTPRGKNNIKVCLGTACFVRGGKKITEKIIKELGIEPGETTADREYSLQVNRCLGVCGISPVMVVNDKIFRKVNPGEVVNIINSNKR